jgi:serine/threonine protein kinase
MEYKIMTSMNHPYIVRCYDAKETDTQVFLFLELMEGGELFDKIIEMSKFSEAMAAEVSYNVLGALNYMHSKGIIHRDLKPENMLIAKKGDIGQIKLTDFGLSKMIDEQSTIMKTACGTPAYVAPEVLNNKGHGYDHKVDVWSMGVIIYILLCGFPPFYGSNDSQLFSKIKRGDYKFLKPYWDPISAEAKDFVKKMLVVDPKQANPHHAATTPPPHRHHTVTTTPRTTRTTARRTATLPPSHPPRAPTHHPLHHHAPRTTTHYHPSHRHPRGSG